MIDVVMLTVVGVLMALVAPRIATVYSFIFITSKLIKHVIANQCAHWCGNLPEFAES